MYLTEEKARGKWCPQARMEGDEGGTWNRTMSLLKRIFGWTGNHPYPEETCNCIASECMMFRHSGITYKDKPIDNGYYCGIAGKPCTGADYE